MPRVTVDGITVPWILTAGRSYGMAMRPRVTTGHAGVGQRPSRSGTPMRNGIGGMRAEGLDVPSQPCPGPCGHDFVRRKSEGRFMHPNQMKPLRMPHFV